MAGYVPRSPIFMGSALPRCTVQWAGCRDYRDWGMPTCCGVVPFISIYICIDSLIIHLYISFTSFISIEILSIFYIHLYTISAWRFQIWFVGPKLVISWIPWIARIVLDGSIDDDKKQPEQEGSPLYGHINHLVIHRTAGGWLLMNHMISHHDNNLIMITYK